MNKRILVTDFNKELIGKCDGQTFVIRTSDPGNLVEIRDTVFEKNTLYCIMLETGQPLSDLEPSDRWNDIPVSIYCKGLGNFKEFIRKKEKFIKSSLKVFFVDGKSPETYTQLKILASLGIHCGLKLEGSVQWDLVHDLMIYYVYTRAPHGTIEPFRYVIDHYNPMQPTDFSAIYFNAPEKFIHINTKEEIALTREGLEQGEVIARGLDSLSVLDKNPALENYRNAWQDYFLQEDGCAYCPGWRVCLGKFAATQKINEGCKALFSDLMDAADFKKTKRQKGDAL